ncbi:hypothetical protein M3A49_31060 [Paraburkholderia sp. CNPSo 3076]|uniref:hypothetical protein n=1 Tax=Paraburkholderia sp. CNPSo 3076 TaxID=2940936 RepID=UPI0022505F09|nr:hypothetical protein [Paraburkholderia sp. CNPSo 3076]MCX5543872.1 hypothetical protein [Paraburkholderia sp. CNPSo 3076]
MKILELPAPYVTPRDVVLPRRDAYGVLHGAQYVPLCDPAEINIATRASFAGVKVQRVHEARSLNEMRAIYAFSFNPYVIDIREQYPVYNQEAYNRARLAGSRMPKSQIMRYDVVLTLVLPPDSYLHYHGVSIKDGNERFGSRVIKRHQRESDNFAARGWTWESLLGSQLTKLAYGNHALMQTWIANADIRSLYDEAGILAMRLQTRSLRGTLHDILERHARHLGISLDHAFELFAVAVSFGFLWIDDSQYLRVDRPLGLQRWMP